MVIDDLEHVSFMLPQCSKGCSANAMNERFQTWLTKRTDPIGLLVSHRRFGMGQPVGIVPIESRKYQQLINS